MKLLIGGDFAPRGEIKARIEKGDYAFLDELRQRTADVDFTIINLESPFVEKNDRKIEKWGPNLGCPVKTVDALKYAGVNVVTLANNHILDYGESAMWRTKVTCEGKGILTVGVGNSITDASKPLIIERDNIKVGIINCCENEFSVAGDGSAGANPLDIIGQYYAIMQLKSEVDKVMIIVHGGHEMFNLPSVRMQNTYRFFVDAGADVVINHHQHCYSGYEIYKGSPIFYGLGNLCFDGLTNAPDCWFYGYMVGLTFGEESLGFEILPYEQFKEEPKIKFLEREAFSSELARINAIISNPQELKKRCDEYYAKSAKSIPSIFDIYTGRISSALRSRGLLPSFFPKKMKLRIKNHVLCESHFDKVKYYMIHC